MVRTYRARARLRIGAGFREPGELCPEAHTWLRPESWLHTGHLSEAQVSEEGLRDAVREYCPDLAPAIYAELGVAPDVSLVKAGQVRTAPTKRPRTRVRTGKPVAKKAVAKAAQGYVMPYSGNPATSPLDAVRYRIQDTDPSTPLLADAEIQYEIDQLTDLNGADPLLVGAFCCEAIAAKYAGEVAITADGVSYSGDQLQTKYQNLAAALRARYTEVRGLSAAPIAGGVLAGEGREPGTRPMNFRLGMDDNPEAGCQVDDSGEFVYGDDGDCLL